MKCLFLYNPNSGKGKIQRKLQLIERMLKMRYDEVTLYATKSAEDLQMPPDNVRMALVRARRKAQQAMARVGARQ